MLARLVPKLGDLCFRRQAREVHSDGWLPLRKLAHLELPVAHALRLQLHLSRKAALRVCESARERDAARTHLSGPASQAQRLAPP